MSTLYMSEGPWKLANAIKGILEVDGGYDQGSASRDSAATGCLPSL